MKSTPGSLVLVASPSARQSGEWLRKAADMLLKLGIAPKGDGDNEISLQLPNRSRIVGLPGTEGTVRGFSAVSLLVIDEASRVEDAMYKALLPMLAVSGGDLWLMSTPYGKRGFFYENWAHGGPQWLKVTVPATDCPRIDKAFLEEQRGAMGAEWFRQEYLCEFVCGSGSVFDMALIEAAMDDTVEPLFPQYPCSPNKGGANVIVIVIVIKIHGDLSSPPGFRPPVWRKSGADRGQNGFLPNEVNPRRPDLEFPAK